MARRVVIELAVNDDGTASVKRFADGLEHSVEKGSRAAQRSLDQMHAKMGQTIDGLARRAAQLTTIFGGIGAAMTVKGGLDFGMAFEHQMSGVKAVANASGVEFGKLISTARQLGPTLGFSAVEAGSAMENLALAGFTNNQIYKLLPGTMALARAGAIGLADAATIASDTLRGMGLSADEFGRVADVISYGASYSNAEISDLGQSMKYVGSVAAAIGMPIEEVTAGLAVLANQGIRADMAGTGLRRILSVMMGNLEEGEKGLKAYNLRLFDAHGKFVGLTEAVLQFQKAGISAQEIMEAFGERGGPTMLRLMQAGADEVARFQKNMEKATGTTQQMAETRMDNLSGDVSKLVNAGRELALVFYEQASPHLREFAKDATEALKAVAEFAKTPGVIKGVADGTKLLVITLTGAAAIKFAQTVVGWTTALWSYNAATIAAAANTANLAKEEAVALTGFAKLNVTAGGFTKTLAGIGAFTAGWALGRTISEVTGLDAALQNLFSHTKAVRESQQQSVNMTLEFYERVKNKFGNIGNVPGVPSDEDLAKFQQLKARLDDVTASYRFWNERGGLPGGGDTPEEEFDRFRIKLEAGLQTFSDLYHESIKLRRDFPKIWTEACAGTNDFYTRVRFAQELVEQQRKSMEAEAKKQEEIAARKKASSEEEVKSQKTAADEMRKILAGYGIYTEQAANDFVAKWGRMTAAAKAEHIKIADLVSAYKKELLDYAKGVEAAGGKIAKALEEPVRSAREEDAAIQAARKSADEWATGMRLVDQATGVSIDSIGELAATFDALEKEVGRNKAIDILKDKILSVFKGATLRGWDLGPFWESLHAGAVAASSDSKTINRALETIQAGMENIGRTTPEGFVDFIEGMDALVASSQQAGISMSDVFLANHDAIIQMTEAAIRSGIDIPDAWSAIYEAAKKFEDSQPLIEWAKSAQESWSQIAVSSLEAFSMMIGETAVGLTDLGESATRLLQQVGAQAISMLVQMGLKRLILSLFASKASAAEGAAALASGLAQVYVNSFASAAAIPVTGWAMAPGIASANLAAATAGATGAAAAGAGIGAGMTLAQSMTLGAVPFADGGLVSRPTFALIGERWKEEAVVPLEGEGARKVARAIGADKQGTVNHYEIHQHFHGDNWSNSGISDDLAEVVALAIGTLVKTGRIGPLPTEVRG